MTHKTYWLHPRSGALLASLIAVLGTAAFASAGPSVAFVSQHFVYLDEYDALADLRDAGFEVGTLGWDAVTAEALEPFNAIVLTDIPDADERGRLSGKVEAACATIRAYCQAGGGVLACMGAGGWDKGRQAANLLLKPWDAELLDEQVTDPEHLYRQTRGIRWAYSWTTNVTPSPITEGVRTVYYPAQAWRADSQKTLYAPKLGADWQVLVRGEKSARSVTAKPVTDQLDMAAATYATEPPIAAARPVDKGRAAVLALWPNWTFWGARKACMESVVWEAGAGGVPSDTGRFCAQLLQWLAEPSVKGGAFGGYVTPENPPTRPEEYVAHEIDWSKAAFASPPMWKHFRVLAGARTRYTGGEGTVQEYCAAAKAAGYQAVLFAEQLERLTPANWDRLRKECAAATTPEFLALPGLDFTTLQGDEYVAFGEFDFPKPPGLAADGKHIDDTYNLWGSQMHSGFLAVTRLHAHPDRDPQILKNMTACAVHTYRDGKLIDDSLDHYLALDAQFHNLVPLSLHLVTSPAQVKTAAQTGLQNVWRVNDALDLKEQITPHSQAGLLYWLNPQRAHLTSGPTLTDWQGLNVMYWGPPAKGSDRWKIRFEVTSPAGVTEVKVLDRGEPYLRFAGNGQSCAQEFPGFHDNQHVFHLLATDGEGRRLLSPGIRIRFSQAYMNQCGDHQNTISACLQRNRRGHMMYTWGTTMGVYAGWRPTWSAPCPVDATEAYPPQWDGGGTGAGGKAAVMVTVQGGIQEGGENSAASNLYEVAGPEVQILNQVVKSKYPEGTPPRGDCTPTYRTTPTEFIDYSVRRVTPTAKFERAGLSLNEITVTAKQDFTFDPGTAAPLHGYAFSDYGSRPEGISDHVFASFADGRSLTRVGPPGAKPCIVEGDMGVGNYVAAYPNLLGAGAVFPLTPVRAHLTLTERLFGTTFGLPLRGEQVRKGQSWTLRFLAASAATSLEEGNQAFDEIRRTLGLGCKPAYEVRVERGQVEDTTGRLLVKAADSAFAATLTKTAMPTDLFVHVTGLTDGWTAAKQVNGGALEAITAHGGTGYTNLDLNLGDVAVVVGHPVTCSNPAVRLVVWWTEGGLEVFAQNPTEAGITCTLRANDAFKGLPPGEKTIALAAGGVTSVPWQ
jgi:hypothetical protein